MKQIKLSNTCLFALVDDDKYEFLNRFNWFLQIGSNTWYVRTTIGKQAIYMHQLVLPSPLKELTPDHINGNTLDNQLNNLRLATKTQQRANRKKAISITTASKYKGISWNNKNKKFYARIRQNGHQINLGYFKNEIDAAKAYNKAAEKEFGEFARLNIIEEIN